MDAVYSLGFAESILGRKNLHWRFFCQLDQFPNPTVGVTDIGLVIKKVRKNFPLLNRISEEGLTGPQKGFTSSGL